MRSRRTTILTAATALAVALLAAPAGAQDTTGVLRAVGRAREALRDLPSVWRLDGDTISWLFVTREHAFATERRADRDLLVPVRLPSDAPRANMSYDFEGRRWAMVVLPLGADVDVNARLLVHEAMHTFQPTALPHPGRTEPMEGGDFLDQAPGRTWLFLELRALARAITAMGESRREAARDAYGRTRSTWPRAFPSTPAGASPAPTPRHWPRGSIPRVRAR
jgi:hypothetical protein